MDQAQQPSQYPSLQAPQPLHTIPNGHSPSLYHQPQQQERQGSADDNNEELIPTAIVIKNIPFAIKREQLTDVMSEMHLPLPYAFNYHFDHGVFRGLAFANFSSPEETAIVIEAMNHMELQGRKLRVEYKKMLPVQERERIEREKRERRGQLEEQHRPMQSMTLHTAASISSISSALPATSPSPVSMRGQQDTSKLAGLGEDTMLTMVEIDMNDAKTLDYYAKLVVFKDDESRRVFVIEPPVSATYRRIIHELAHKLGLEHESAGSGDMRHVQVFKDKRTNNLGLQTSSLLYNDTQRRGLARAATMDFNESRDSVFHSLRTQNSALLDVPGSPGGLAGLGQRSLREAKSFGDLQNRSASPGSALSTGSFPAALTQNVTRYNEYGILNTQSSGSNLALSGRDDSYLTNGFANMSLGGYDRNSASSRLTGRAAGMNGDVHVPAGAIGSQRSQHGLNGLNSLNGYEEAPRNSSSSAVERQPRGPGAEWGSGFTRPRQNGHGGRGSGDLDLSELEQAAAERQSQNTNSRYM
jgi:hypothetical protein